MKLDKTYKVSVLGSGSWGTTFAKILADAGCEVLIWGRNQTVVAEINEESRNSRYLPGIRMPESVRATLSFEELSKHSDTIFLAVPAQRLRYILRDFKSYMEQDVFYNFVSLMKGLEKNTNLRMSEVIRQEMNYKKINIAVISGPNLAKEIALEQPAGAVVSSNDINISTKIAMICRTKYLATFINDDIVGTEYAGVLKNLIALAIGIVDGVGYGENTKATIITRGLAEMTEFSVAYGANYSTLQGLAGLGDLVATCNSSLSRNNTAGRLLGQGYSINDIIRTMDQTAEGISSVEPVLELAKQKNVYMPIVEEIRMLLRGELLPNYFGVHLASSNGLPEYENKNVWSS